MRRKSNQKLRRLNVTLPRGTVESIERVREMIGAASDSEVVRRAIRVYHFTLFPPDGTEVLIRAKSGEAVVII